MYTTPIHSFHVYQIQDLCYNTVGALSHSASRFQSQLNPLFSIPGFSLKLKCWFERWFECWDCLCPPDSGQESPSCHFFTHYSWIHSDLKHTTILRLAEFLLRPGVKLSIIKLPCLFLFPCYYIVYCYNYLCVCVCVLCIFFELWEWQQRHSMHFIVPSHWAGRIIYLFLIQIHHNMTQSSFWS